MRIAVAATAPFGAAILEGLAGRGYDIELLLTRPDKPQGRGRKRAAPPAKESAKRFDIPVEQPDRLTAFPGEARVVVIAGYGVLIPEKLLAERLWLNVHPSLLPRWRGAAPVERALMAGDGETGVSIIKLVKELDAGPIAAQESFALRPEDDAGSVFLRAAEVAAELLARVLADPPARFREQVGEPSYAAKITAGDRRLDLEQPAQQIVDPVPAL